MNNEALAAFLRTAKKYGCEPDQLRNFLSAGYVPQEKQLEFHGLARLADRPTGPDRIAIAGDRGGAKSHGVMSQVAIDDCQRFPGLECLYLRKVGKAARKALDQLRERTFIKIPHRYNRNEGLIRFENGSSIVVGHFKDDRDIDQYLGIEYDLIVVEEATQLSESKVDLLFGSLRSSKNWRPRAYLATNPGGVGHQWFKKAYIIPHREGKRDGRYRVVIASWRDNVFIDEGYKEYLMSLKGVLGRMWRDGDWDVGAGQFFTAWSYDDHVIDPITVHYTWPVWISFDYGYNHPTAVYWHTYNDGVVYTIREHVQNRWLPSMHVAEMERISSEIGRKLSTLPVVAGRDAFATGRDMEARSVAEQYSLLNVSMKPANDDRISGAAEMLNRLGDPLSGEPATWKISSECPRLIETIPMLQSDPARPEDVLKVDADEEGNNGDDPYDSARYGLMERPLYKAGGFSVRV